jgi:ketosteroid isomerase-like protein
VTYTITGPTAEGDRVAAEVEGSADTPAGPFHNRYHFLFELRGGLIVVAKEYADSLYMHMFSKRVENAR